MHFFLLGLFMIRHHDRRNSSGIYIDQYSQIDFLKGWSETGIGPAQTGSPDLWPPLTPPPTIMTREAKNHPRQLEISLTEEKRPRDLAVKTSRSHGAGFDPCFESTLFLAPHVLVSRWRWRPVGPGIGTGGGNSKSHRSDIAPPTRIESLNHWYVIENVMTASRPILLLAIGHRMTMSGEPRSRSCDASRNGAGARLIY